MCRIQQSKHYDITTKFIGVSGHYSIKIYHINMLIEFYVFIYAKIEKKIIPSTMDGI